MSLFQLPYELQYGAFMNASYEELVNYCQSSFQASQLCYDEVFWQQKALRDLGKSIDNNIAGATPAQRYAIFRQIVRSKNPFGEAVSLGQSQYIIYNWSINHDFNSIDIAVAARAGHFDTLRVLLRLLQNAKIQPGTIGYVFTSAYRQLLGDDPRILDAFEQIVVPDYLWLLKSIRLYSEDYNLYDLVIKRAGAQGQLDIAQTFYENVAAHGGDQKLRQF